MDRRYTLFVGETWPGRRGVYAHFAGGIIDVEHWLGAEMDGAALPCEWGPHSTSAGRLNLAMALLWMAGVDMDYAGPTQRKLALYLMRAPDTWSIQRHELRGLANSMPFLDMVREWFGHAASVMTAIEMGGPSRN